MTHPDFIQMKDDIDRANGVDSESPAPGRVFYVNFIPNDAAAIHEMKQSASRIRAAMDMTAPSAFEQELDEYARQWLLDADIRDMEEALALTVGRDAQ